MPQRTFLPSNDANLHPTARSRRSTLKATAALLALGSVLVGCGGDGDRKQITASGQEHLNDRKDVDVNEALSSLETEHSATISLAVYHHEEDKTFLHHANEWSYEASIVKVPIALTLLRRAVFEQRTLTEEEKALIEASINYSDNSSTTEIFRRIGTTGSGSDSEASSQSLNKTYELLGAMKTRSEGTWGNNQTWAEDYVKIMRFIVEDIHWITKTDAEYLLETMNPNDWSQLWGVGSQKDQTVFGKQVQQVSVKNGWIQDETGTWYVNSVGVIQTEDNTFSIALLSHGFNDVNIGYEVASTAMQAYFDHAG